MYHVSGFGVSVTRLSFMHLCEHNLKPEMHVIGQLARTFNARDAVSDYINDHYSNV